MIIARNPPDRNRQRDICEEIPKNTKEIPKLTGISLCKYFATILKHFLFNSVPLWYTVIELTRAGIPGRTR